MSLSVALGWWGAMENDAYELCEGCVRKQVPYLRS